MSKEQVNHPAHYNQHPSGIECIEIIRHYVSDIANAIKYLWRAGLKYELGKKDYDKEREDLEKALWYIKDYYTHCPRVPREELMCETMNKYVHEVTGYTIGVIIKGHDDSITRAMRILLRVGLVRKGCVRNIHCWDSYLKDAAGYINKRISDIMKQQLYKDCEEMNQMLNGIAVEGMDYAKPGCVRQDEPENYDPLNMIIIQGNAFSLSKDVRMKPNGAVYSPCDNCALREECQNDCTGQLCSRLHKAFTEEYYIEVGTCRYHPHLGTIEVVDDTKAARLALTLEMKED